MWGLSLPLTPLVRPFNGEFDPPARCRSPGRRERSIVSPGEQFLLESARALRCMSLLPAEVANEANTAWE